jgi:hypothetical protein
MSTNGNAEAQNAGAITSPLVRPEYDPIFRLFTVVYGTVVALTFKPFVDAIYPPHSARVTFCDVVLLVLLFAFFVVDWVWSAAYLLNYWLKSPREHKFHAGFCGAKPWMRMILLILHFGLICTFAVFAYTAWLFEWDYGQNPPIPIEGRPVFWWLCSVTFAFVWDMLMDIGAVKIRTTDSLDRVIKFFYFLTYGLTFLVIGVILFSEYEFFSHSQYVPQWWLDNAKHLVMGTLALQILLRVITYFKIEKLVDVQNGKSGTDPIPAVATGT